MFMTEKKVREFNLWAFFRSLVACQNGNRIVCVVQDLDQTPNSVRLLRTLQSVMDNSCSWFRLILSDKTTRTFNPEFPQTAGMTITLPPNKQNFTDIVEDEMAALFATRPGLSSVKNEILAEIHSVFGSDSTMNARGDLYVSSIVKSWLSILVEDGSPITRSSITETARLLPSTLDGMYLELLQHVAVRSRYSGIMRAVLWGLRAFRPLKISQLALAAAIETDDLQSIDTLENRKPVDLVWDIEIAFGGLVYLEDNQIKPRQLLFRDCVVQNHRGPCQEACPLCQESHAVIARKCLTFIHMYAGAKAKQNRVFTEDESALFHYAVRHWPDHYEQHQLLRSVPQGTLSEPIDFQYLSKENDVLSEWATEYLALYSQGNPTGLKDPIIAATAAGCLELVKSLIKSPQISGESVAACLEIAMASENDALTRLLMNNDAKCLYPLHTASLAVRPDIIARFFTPQCDLEVHNECGLTPLQVACKSGNLPVVELLLREGSRADSITSTGKQTPLHLACQYGYPEIVTRLLIMNDVDPNAKDENGRTPLHVACQWLQPRTVERLLHFVDNPSTVHIEEVDQDESTAFHLVAQLGRLDILQSIVSYANSSPRYHKEELDQLLLQENARGETPLYLAADAGHMNVIGELLSRDGFLALLKRDSAHHIPLCAAVRNRHTAAARTLISQLPPELLKGQLQPEPTDTGKQRCPIHIAVEVSDYDVAEILCKAHQAHEVSLDLFYGEEELTPLHIAVKSESVDMTDLLLSYTATPNIVDDKGMTPLSFACKLGNLRLVKALLEKNADIDSVDKDGKTPLHFASSGEHLEVVGLLLKRGVNPNIEDDKKMTPVLFACKMGNLQIVKALLAEKADLRSVDEDGNTSLHLAAFGGHPEVVGLLLENGADISQRNLREECPLAVASTQTVMLVMIDKAISNQSLDNNLANQALHEAAEKGFGEVISRYLQGKLCCELQPDDQEQTLYHRAVLGKSRNILKELLDRGVPGYDAFDKQKRTPIFLAIEKGHSQIVELLLDKSAGQLAIPDSNEDVALLLAAEQGRLEGGHAKVLERLSEYNVAGLNHKNNEGQTPLILAASAGQFEAVEYLLEQKAQIHEKDSSGCTALHRAAQKGDSGVVEALLKADGAEKDAQNNDGETPLYIAAYCGNIDAVKILIEYQCSVTIPEKDGWQPLTAAYDNAEILRILVEKANADVHCTKVSDGWTVLHYAVAFVRHDSVRTLLELKADPFRPNDYGITAIHTAADGPSKSEIMRTLLESLSDEDKARLDIGDEDGNTALKVAIDAHSTQSACLLLEFGQLDQNQLFEDEQPLVALAQEEKMHDLVDWLLGFEPMKLNKASLLALVGISTKQRDQDVQDRAMKCLEDQDFDKLLPVAMATDDPRLLRQVAQSHPDPNYRDEHGWTFSQVMAAAGLEDKSSSPPLSSENDHDHRGPSAWSTHPELTIHYDTDERYGKLVVKSDHPIPLNQKFYFEVLVMELTEISDIVGIGFGHQFTSENSMPGWESISWGLHGDDGGLYHKGYAFEMKEEWTYRKDDCIGCLIDPVQKRAFFTKNGEPLVCFTKIYGRLFPMVALGPKVKVMANFGKDELSPFQYSGADLDYANMQIQEVDGED
ncbi:uncharacterized protein N7484_001077 [Penicillium longicatenatum]|uniref:uncharacterized protein n=1 Tax=Penicillium longicatenatum TaxID=1561947 RepID=UPI0025490F12|nr:uncharacterized protein N7484_001077 [Penicillium longicatenatum]KAJ5657428.1 hypothetical protein N7484_001077 [Penicillium longicatenatum]